MFIAFFTGLFGVLYLSTVAATCPDALAQREPGLQHRTTIDCTKEYKRPVRAGDKYVVDLQVKD